MSLQKEIEAVLTSSEEVKYKFTVSPRYRKILGFIWGIFGILFTMGVVTVWAAFYYGFYLKAANSYGFTNKRIIARKGWLSVNTVTVDFNKVTDIRVREGIVERFITKTGTLVINTAGTHKEEIVLRNIDDPHKIKKKLSEIMEDKTS